jgi:uncharacterized membrane protein
MTVTLSRALFWLLSVLIALVSLRILVLGAEVGFPNMVRQFGHLPVLWAHVVAASVALLVMPFQFWGRLRARRPAVHRWTGRVYVLAVGVGGLSGIWMAFFTITGPVAGAGFLVLAILWLAVTWQAYAAARARDFAAHRRWMIRSAGLTFAAVTLRLYLGLSMAAGLPFDPAYTVIAWACWVPNALIVEWALRRGTVAKGRLPAA